MMTMLWKIWSVVCFLAAPLAAFSQVLSGASEPPLNGQSLAAALATASVPSQRIYLAVAAETVTLPQYAPILPSNSSLTTVTDTYQRSVRAFAAVTAIAPPTMFVLNLHPADPNIDAGLQPEQAFKLFAASLNNGQWQDLIGDHGVGLSDLTSDDQRMLFQMLFPQGQLQVGVSHPTADAPTGELDLSSELSQVRLRLSQSVDINLQMQGQPNGWTGGSSNDPAPYHWIERFTPLDPLKGVPQSAEIPNVLKTGQLDWNQPALRSLVSLSGLKTVGDLIGRVAQMTHIELYADKRYEGKSLTILGNTASAPAGDVLRALAFCVTGTFRRVGPAYVLTNEIMGTEAQRIVQGRFARDADLHQKEQMNKASDIMGTKHSLHNLASYGNPLALTADENKLVPYDTEVTPSWPSITLPLSQLTPAQQENVRQQAASMAQMRQASPSADISVPDLNGKVRLTVRPHLQILVPSLSSPVETSLPFFQLFDLSFKLLRERQKAREKEHPEASDAQSHSMSLAQAMALTSHRGLLVEPSSAAELTADVMQMKHLGFNELWLKVFSQGHLKTVAADGKDLLTQALRLTHGSNIRVYAVVDLFQWGMDAPSDAIDLDNLGQTSVQAETYIHQAASAEADVTGNPPPSSEPILGLSVNPLDPEVSQRLMALARNLAGRSGLAGIVWCKTAPGGYDNEPDNNYSANQPDLGYTVANRLAFLRQQHADPIDLSETRTMTNTGNAASSMLVSNMGNVNISLNGGVGIDPATSIPGFDTQEQDAELSIAWDKFRMDADLGVIQSLYHTVRVTNQTVPIFVQQRRSDFSENWYGSWDRPTALLPDWRVTSFRPGAFREDHIAKKQSQLALAGLDANDAHSISGLASALSDNLKDTTWDGFVWDITQVKPSHLTL